MAQRDTKRLFIIIIYLVLFVIIATAVYFFFKPNPSCSDGKRNQGEEAVDCGGPCIPCPQIVNLQPIEIKSVEWVYDIDNKYDVAAQVANPNDVYGVASVRYRAKTKNDSGVILDESEWSEDFVLPGETKYFFVQGFRVGSDSNFDEIEFEIDEENIEWERFKDYEEPNLIINNPGYEEVSGDVGFGRAFGTIINRSNVDLEIVRVKVVLRDQDNKLLALNHQVMNTLRSNEFRDYVINFPHHFPGSAADVKAYPESNPFDSENYIRIYGRPDRWDEN